jgi:hypothetical protein
MSRRMMRKRDNLRYRMRRELRYALTRKGVPWEPGQLEKVLGPRNF